METIALNLYSIDELSDDARKVAINNERKSIHVNGIPWADEYRDSLTAFCEEFSVELDRDGDYRRSTMDENVLNLSGNRLRTYLVNNYSAILDECCPFTGFCGDDDVLKPMREFVQRPNLRMDFAELLSECVFSFQRTYSYIVDYHYSDEGIVEELRSLDCQFTEDGKLFHQAIAW